MENFKLLYLKFLAVAFLISVLILAFSFHNIIGKDTDTFSNAETLNSNITIILDAGHGGEDGGAFANGVTEKDINLAVTKYLYSFLSMTDYNVVLTRNDDTLLYSAGEEKKKKYHDIVNRIKIANSYDNAIFISIHQNKFEISKYKGLQVYYSKNNQLSKILADSIQINTKTNLDTQNMRETKEGGFNIKLLKTLEMPSVLVECGFLSNPEEAEKLRDTAYQKKLAYILFDSTVKFLEENGEKIL